MEINRILNCFQLHARASHEVTDSETTTTTTTATAAFHYNYYSISIIALFSWQLHPMPLVFFHLFSHFACNRCVHAVLVQIFIIHIFEGYEFRNDNICDCMRKNYSIFLVFESGCWSWYIEIDVHNNLLKMSPSPSFAGLKLIVFAFEMIKRYRSSRGVCAISRLQGNLKKTWGNYNLHTYETF